ncbi:MAG: tyrosine-type recombinase/integrase [Pyrinomonadaceae bacterium]|nr:tyrosine-type recombinase/integrase [Pyrinomonadaceae bacterium]
MYSSLSAPIRFSEISFAPALRKAGIQGASWHSVRHTAASRRIMAGVDLVTVKEFLGHRDIETTMQYSHLSPAHIKEGANRGSLGATLLQIPERNWDLNRDQEIASTTERVQPRDLLVRPEGLEPPTPRSVVSHRESVKDGDGV